MEMENNSKYLYILTPLYTKILSLNSDKIYGIVSSEISNSCRIKEMLKYILKQEDIFKFVDKWKEITCCEYDNLQVAMIPYIDNYLLLDIPTLLWKIPGNIYICKKIVYDNAVEFAGEKMEIFEIIS